MLLVLNLYECCKLALNSEKQIDSEKEIPLPELMQFPFMSVSLRVVPTENVILAFPVPANHVA